MVLYLKRLNSKSEEDERNYIRKKSEIRRTVNAEKKKIWDIIKRQKMFEKTCEHKKCEENFTDFSGDSSAQEMRRIQRIYSIIFFLCLHIYLMHYPPSSPHISCFITFCNFFLRDLHWNRWSFLHIFCDIFYRSIMPSFAFMYRIEKDTYAHI